MRREKCLHTMSCSVRSVPDWISCGLVFLWSASQRCPSSFISFLIAPPAQVWAPPSANTAHVSPPGHPSLAVGPWGVFKKACLCLPRNAGPTIHPGRWAQSLKSKEIQKIGSWRTLGYNSDRMKYVEKINRHSIVEQNNNNNNWMWECCFSVM